MLGDWVINEARNAEGFFSRMQSLVIVLFPVMFIFMQLSYFCITKTQLYRRFLKLHVYAYGAAPCVDYVIADACSQFVTR